MLSVQKYATARQTTGEEEGHQLANYTPPQVGLSAYVSWRCRRNFSVTQNVQNSEGLTDTCFYLFVVYMFMLINKLNGCYDHQ